MPAKIWSWKTGLVAALVTVTAVWTSYGPDSMLQNNVADGLKAWSAKGRLVALSDDQPLGNRRPIVVVLGMNNSTDINGPSEDTIKKTLALPMAACQGIYWDRTGRELYQDSKWYCYWYNHNGFTDEQLAKWLRMQWEKDDDLTRANLKEVELISHSRGVRVIAEDYSKTQGSKTDLVIGLAGALQGGPLSVRGNIEQGLQKAFGYAGTQLNKAVGAVAKFLGIEFDAKGTQELQPSNSTRWVLDSNWYLIAGSVDVSDKSVIQKSLNLVLAGDQAFARLTGSGAPQDATYYQATALAIESLGQGPNDGMVTVPSAHGDGIAGSEKTHKITLPNHNHSEMLQGNGGTELWSTVMEILIPRIVPNQDVISNFDLWLPELPDDIKLPIISSGTTLTDARLVFANDAGEIWITSDNGTNPTELHLGAGRFSWPQWAGNDLILTRERAGSDIVMVRASDNKLIQLTTDGKSNLAGVDDAGQMIVFLSNGQLLLRDKVGIAKVLVKGPLTLDSPPVLIGSNVYFATKQADTYTLCTVSVTDKETELSQAREIASGLNQPIKIGTGLLALQSTGEGSQLVVVSVLGSIQLNQKLNSWLEIFAQPDIPSVTMIDIDSRQFRGRWADCDIYLISDGWIRQLDTDLVEQSRGKDTPVEIAWETLAWPISPAIQLDVK